MSKTEIQASADLDAQLDFFRQTDDLRELNEMLTRTMAQLKIHALIKDVNLSIIVDAVVRLTRTATNEHRVMAAAVLGRLAAVARGRELIVFSAAPRIFLDEPPPSLDCLDDPAEKNYAAIIIHESKKQWVVAYCVQEALSLGEAKDARKTLLQSAMGAQKSLVDGWRLLGQFVQEKKENSTVGFARKRRVSIAWLEVVKEWSGEVGNNPGLALADWVGILLKGDIQGNDEEVRKGIADDALEMLLRIIELRFSHALVAETYVVLDRVRTRMGRNVWGEYIRESRVVSAVQTCMREAALVLARQNRTDKELVDVLCAIYGGKAQMSVALKRHFENATELDPEIREWWQTAGHVSQSHRDTQHQIGNSEDQQIGALLIEVESSKLTMEKLARAVIPFLEISDPVLAATVTKAAASYSDISRIARQLARMRKLSQTDLLGLISEYNPLQHEMLGGHQSGVRKIKVVREGIQKDFAGRIKTLVKPWVEPSDK
ncbi:hypothetical protein [Janthinobacterium sp. RB2R34]|uniref:hypothetical protein n=1 Tax=Janthinobacterium sp. RB2R34 TaxID=3424193 RepID=UPI003F272427